METLIISTMCQCKGQIYGEFCTIAGGLGREKLWVVESGDRNMRMWLAQTWRLGSDPRLQSHMTLLEQGHIPPQQLLLCHLRSVSGIPPALLQFGLCVRHNKIQPNTQNSSHQMKVSLIKVGQRKINALFYLIEKKKVDCVELFAWFGYISNCLLNDCVNSVCVVQCSSCCFVRARVALLLCFGTSQLLWLLNAILIWKYFQSF